MNAITTLDNWTTAVCKSFFLTQENNQTLQPIHSCIIQGTRHFFHAPDLKEKDPQYFQQLSEFAEKNGIRLQADRRKNGEFHNHCRRKKFLPVLFLAFGIQMNWAMADEEPELGIDTQRDAMVQNQYTEFDADSDTFELDSDGDNSLSQAIETILLSHFVEQADDPENIYSEIKALAEYYSRYPEAVALIEAIADTDWSLKYAPFTFQTDIEGTRLSIHHTTVYFDPRSAAKLKFYNRCSTDKPYCIASPADALLHEFLHVQTITLDSAKFFKEGGMVGTLYPSQHEQITIQKENRLYRAMTERDNKPRPIRNDHTGRHILVSCATCID